MFRKKDKTGAGGEEGEEWEEYWVGEDGEEVPVGSSMDDDNQLPEEYRDPVPVPAVEAPIDDAVEEEEKEEAPKKGLFGFTRPPPKPEKPALKPMSWRKIEKQGEEEEGSTGGEKREGKVIETSGRFDIVSLTVTLLYPYLVPDLTYLYPNPYPNLTLTSPTPILDVI